MQKLIINVIHNISGRIRMRLSDPPKDFLRMEKLIQGHPGIFSIQYTHITRSLLVLYDINEVSGEEIILRTSLSLSIDYQLNPVSVLIAPREREMSDSAFHSAILLTTALAFRLRSWNDANLSLVDWIAALGTTGAIVEHAWDEIKNEGDFHPEVLSVIYLITSMFHKNFLPAAIVAWFTAFTRHLVHLPPIGAEIKPIALSEDEPEETRYEVIVSKNDPKDKLAFFRLLLSAVADTLSGESREKQNLTQKIYELTQSHGNELEGLGKRNRGITLRIR